MGFFAILKDPGDPTNGFSIRECHINLWALRGLFGRRNFFWDVGLRVRAGTTPFQNFQVALPSGMPKSALTDLYDKLLDQKIGRLIFSHAVNVVNGDTIDYGSGPLRLSHIPPTDARIDETKSDDEFTLWNLRVATPVPASTECYLRIRFAVTSIGRVWTWKRFLFARCGSLIDVRFLDLRETSHVRDGESLQDRIVPIEKLNFFVIAPSFYHLVATSPSVHYIRILEGQEWEAYLRRRVALFFREKLTIYQWRNPKDVPLTINSPLRVYLDLGSQLGLLSIPNVIVLIALGVLISSFGVLLAPNLPSDISKLTTTTAAFGRQHLAGVTITAAIVFLFSLGDRIAKLRKTYQTIRTAVLRVENWVLSRN